MKNEALINPDAKPILVIGGGIAGITAALEAAETGCRVILVEEQAYLGGRVARMYQYFPKMCPPTCGLEINTRRLRQNSRVIIHTMATVEALSGEACNFKATIKVKPRYVTGDSSLDEAMLADITSERSNEHNLGMDKTKAVYRPFPMSYPPDYVVDKDALSDEDAKKLLAACPEGAIDLDMKEKSIDAEVGAVIVATGWRPYDATNLDVLGYGVCENVITNVQMERLAAKDGPTGGQILRPSDGKPPENIAFVQCAGSRDENHLSYCSAICCMGSLKQIRYMREQSETAKASVYYIDIRTLGRQEKFYFDLLKDTNVTFTKGKVVKVTDDASTKNLTLELEDAIAGSKMHAEADLVVLATGVVPNTEGIKALCDLKFDDHGFVDSGKPVDGIYAAGCVKHPCDVSRTNKDATGAALKAIQCLVRT